mmetsp:Transcript_33776/g.111251  ORF Transcript_33776/g.111251 Transcript_33776/m.111251 type:complete len:592 (-) Transcript_33776:640-2415(-)
MNCRERQREQHRSAVLEAERAPHEELRGVGPPQPAPLHAVDVRRRSKVHARREEAARKDLVLPRVRRRLRAQQSAREQRDADARAGLVVDQRHAALLGDHLADPKGDEGARRQHEHATVPPPKHGDRDPRLGRSGDEEYARRRLQHVRRDDGAEDGERAHENGHHAKAEAQRGGRLSARARVVGVGDDSVEAEPREGGDGLAEVVQQSEPALHADDARVALDVQRAKGESLAEAEPAEHDEGLCGGEDANGEGSLARDAKERDEDAEDDVDQPGAVVGIHRLVVMLVAQLEVLARAVGRRVVAAALPRRRTNRSLDLPLRRASSRRGGGRVARRQALLHNLPREVDREGAAGAAARRLARAHGRVDAVPREDLVEVAPARVEGVRPLEDGRVAVRVGEEQLHRHALRNPQLPPSGALQLLAALRCDGGDRGDGRVEPRRLDEEGVRVRLPERHVQRRVAGDPLEGGEGEVGRAVAAREQEPVRHLLRQLVCVELVCTARLAKPAPERRGEDGRLERESRLERRVGLRVERCAKQRRLRQQAAGQRVEVREHRLEQRLARRLVAHPRKEVVHNSLPHRPRVPLGRRSAAREE